VEDTYKDFARRCVTEASRDCLRILTFTTWRTESTLSSWVPDWRAPIADWQGQGHRSNYHVELGWSGFLPTVNTDLDEFHKIRWSNISPAISDDGNELKVQGRVLAAVTSKNAHFFANTELPPLLKFGYDQALQVFPNSYRVQQLARSPPPVAGDVLCLLKGCSAFVYLHPVGSNNKCTITGQKDKCQSLAMRHLLWDVMKYCEEKHDSGKKMERLKFRDHGPEVINAIPEESITIV
jgi:hypothetical protein